MHHDRSGGRAQQPGLFVRGAVVAAASWLAASPALAAAAREPPAVIGIPVDFILFALTLLGVALFHHHTLRVALTGLAVIAGYKILVTGFKHGAGAAGFVAHMGHEWVILSRQHRRRNDAFAAAAGGPPGCGLRWCAVIGTA